MTWVSVLDTPARPIEPRTYRGEPTYDRHSYHGYDEQEQSARPALQQYFDRVRPAA